MSAAEGKEWDSFQGKYVRYDLKEEASRVLDMSEEEFIAQASGVPTP